MQLSDNITDRVVYSVHVHVMLNYWNGYDDKDCDNEDIITFEQFFSVEDLQNNVNDFNKNIETLNILFNINFIDADKHYD